MVEWRNDPPPLRSRGAGKPRRYRVFIEVPIHFNNVILIENDRSIKVFWANIKKLIVFFETSLIYRPTCNNAFNNHNFDFFTIVRIRIRSAVGKPQMFINFFIEFYMRTKLCTGDKLPTPEARIG